MNVHFDYIADRDDTTKQMKLTFNINLRDNARQLEISY